MLGQIRASIKEAYRATATLQASVVFTHYAYAATVDDYLGRKDKTASTQTLSAIVGEVRTDIDDGKNVQRCTLYIDEALLTIALVPDDTATFRGDVWTVEALRSSEPTFIRAIDVRRP